MVCDLQLGICWLQAAVFYTGLGVAVFLAGMVASSIIKGAGKIKEKKK